MCYAREQKKNVIAHASVSPQVWTLAEKPGTSPAVGNDDEIFMTPMQKQFVSKVSSHKENESENVQKEINEDQIIKMDEFLSVVFYDKCENVLQTNFEDTSTKVEHIQDEQKQLRNVCRDGESKMPSIILEMK